MAEDLHRSQSALQALSGAMATLNQVSQGWALLLWLV